MNNGSVKIDNVPKLLNSQASLDFLSLFSYATIYVKVYVYNTGFEFLLWKVSKNKKYFLPGTLPMCFIYSYFHAFLGGTQMLKSFVKIAKCVFKSYSVAFGSVELKPELNIMIWLSFSSKKFQKWPKEALDSKTAGDRSNKCHSFCVVLSKTLPQL